MPASRNPSVSPPWPPADLTFPFRASPRGAGATLAKGHPLSSPSSFSTSSTPLSASPSVLAAYGWDEERADAFAPYEAEGLLAGRVVRVDRGQCDVVTADGTVRADTAFVTPHDPLRVVCT